jgi:A/G-specific adenine glycosylase
LIKTPAEPSFSDRLLAWWDRHGRKDLPWQHPRTAYRVWVSEIMLQQTQVSTVIPYFQRWMERFPGLGSLAAAAPDEVMSLWSGLGYYARARNLHKAAQACVELHGGRLPETAEALCSLPGIGLSTANAIVSQSFDRPAAVLDGNVRRSLARHAMIGGWSGKASVQRALWREAEIRLPNSRGADYTQAIMDLGATLCTRSKPDCGKCPVNGDCAAYLQDKVADYPAPKPRAKVASKTIHMIILRDERNRVLLEKRPPAGIWGGLWSLPQGENAALLASRFGLNLSDARKMATVEHRLTHLQMTIRPSIISTVSHTQVECPGNHQWFELDQCGGLGLPRPVTGLLEQLRHGEEA